MSDQPRTLSDINLEVDGFTADDVLENRAARDELIRKMAQRGNRTCQMSENLDTLAKSFGIDSRYTEELDDEDIY